MKKEAEKFLWGLEALEAKRNDVEQHQAEFAGRHERWVKRNPYFYNSLKRMLRFIVEPQKQVLHIRCQSGFLLESVNPSRGVGVDVSGEMVAIARQNYPQFEFSTAHPEDVNLDESFDYILFSDASDTADVLGALKQLKNMCESHTRLVIYTYNHLWQPVVELAERVRLKMPLQEQNWLSEGDLRGLLALAGFDCLHTYKIVLFPKWLPFVSWFLNRVVAKLPWFNSLCMTSVMVARPTLAPRELEQVSVSVIVPCKDEEGNIEHAVKRIPDMGRHTEIIFCNDKSTDGTADEVRRMQREYPDRDIKLVDGPGICKAENVWTGFNAAQGDVLMILDADLTVMPEELPYFFEAIVAGKGEFINGSRMVYPMQKMAMKFTNMLGNKFFSYVFSYLLNHTVKDTLCGTKVLWRTDWERLRELIGTWGITDRWGDYELLFGAAKLHLRIVDLPVHYQERIYGATKMVKVFHNGLIMLRMCLSGFKKLKMGY